MNFLTQGIGKSGRRNNTRNLKKNSQCSMLSFGTSAWTLPHYVLLWSSFECYNSYFRMIHCRLTSQAMHFLSSVNSSWHPIMLLRVHPITASHYSQGILKTITSLEKDRSNFPDWLQQQAYLIYSGQFCSLLCTLVPKLSCNINYYKLY